MSEDRAYFYLGGDALHTGMYVALIRRLEEEGLVVDLVSRVRLSLNPLASWAAWRNRHQLGPNTIDQVRSQMRGQVHPIPLWSPQPELSLLPLARAVGGCRPNRRVVLHTRQIAMGRLALALRGWCGCVRVIPELEGDNLAESDYRYSMITRPSWWQWLRWKMEKRFYDHHEGRLLRKSDAIVCVSHKLKQVMIARYGLSPEQASRIHVFPSVASRHRFAFSADKRQALRRSLGLEDRFVVMYNGNLGARWQVPEKLVEVFAHIRARRPDAFFLVLTPEEHRPFIRPHIEQAGLAAADYRLATCPHHQVVEYLCAADLGLLLRDRHPMNEVAAPGKFAEYVLTGLPLIMTDGIGDFSEIAKGHECACVLPDLSNSGNREQVQAFSARTFTLEERQAFARWGVDRFSIELYTPQLAELYRTI